MLFYAITNKLASGMQMVTTNIKVVAKESCAIPGGASVPCFRITKELYAKPLEGEMDLKRDIKELTKGATMQSVTEWFAPGIGVVKLEIGMGGRTLASMALTQLKR